MVNVIIVQFSVSHSQGNNEAANFFFFFFHYKKAFVCCAEEPQIGSWTFNILSPLQSKRLISHSAGLWLLTRTNSASCWLVTHTGTAMIGCLAPGGTPLIVCLAYFLPSFWWHILALILIAPHKAEETGGCYICLCVCFCKLCVCRMCLGKTKKPN